MTYGVTADGFVRKTLQEIRQEMKDDLRAVYPDLVILDDDVTGNYINITAEMIGELWELAEADYNSKYVDTAEGVNLDNVLVLNNLTRLGTRKSQLPLARIYGDPTAAVPAGFKTSSSVYSDIQFEVTDEVSVGSQANYIRLSVNETSSFSKDETVKGETSNATGVIEHIYEKNLFLRAVSGTFQVGENIDDQDPYVSAEAVVSSVDAAGYVDVTLVCTSTGIIDPPLNTVETIDTPQAGIKAVTNNSATVVGRATESDSEFRVRRDTRIVNSVGGSTKGILNALTELNEDITKTAIDYIAVFDNKTDDTDASGRPPHCVEAVLLDRGAAVELSGTLTATKDSYTIATTDDLTSEIVAGDTIKIPSDYVGAGTFEYVTVDTVDIAEIVLKAQFRGTTAAGLTSYKYVGRDDEIAEALLISSAGGITTYGAWHIVATDEDNEEYVINFNSPIKKDITLSLTLTTTSGLTTAEVTALKESIADWGNSLGVGQDVIVHGYNCLINQLNNAKITDVVVDLNGNGDNNFTISNGSTSLAEYSYWDVDNITIV